MVLHTMVHIFCHVSEKKGADYGKIYLLVERYSQHVNSEYTKTFFWQKEPHGRSPLKIPHVNDIPDMSQVFWRIPEVPHYGYHHRSYTISSYNKQFPIAYHASWNTPWHNDTPIIAQSHYTTIRVTAHTSDPTNTTNTIYALKFNNLIIWLASHREIFQNRSAMIKLNNSHLNFTFEYSCNFEMQQSLDAKYEKDHF